MKSNNILRKSLVLMAAMLCLAFAAHISAQVQTQTKTATGTPTHEVKVESGEVVAVEGNDLFVKMADGSIRHFPSVPDSATVTVDGKQLGIHDLQPGMKLERTTITTTTPQWVTTIQTVSGKVWAVQAPHWVILSMENGENQKFQVPEGTKFNVGGQDTDIFALRKGMVVTATKIVESPQNVVSSQRQVTGTIPPGSTVLVAKGQPTATPGGASGSAETATTASAQLPKTGSNWPLLGMVGLLLMFAAMGSRVLRGAGRIQG
ncbi:MAG: LPXTG cell wall anchor domain-containing protein [Candidatus Korobacteraceae bacterium]